MTELEWVLGFLGTEFRVGVRVSWDRIRGVGVRVSCDRI